MVVHKQKVRLTAEEETLLITLYAKAYGCPRAFFDDQTARQVIEQIDYDFASLKVPTGTRLTVCLRAKKLDEYLIQFLAQNPRGTVLNLGCGLDSRCVRVEAGEAQWYDLDLPGVIKIREKFFEQTDNYHMIPASVTDFEWMNAITYSDKGVFVVAEGLLMYLGEAGVKSLVIKLQEEFPGCELACDAFSRLTARNVKGHPSLKKTGAVVAWGIDDPKEIETWREGIRFKEEWFFTQAEEIKLLSPGNRLMFQISGMFSVAKKAHRILHYQLGTRHKE